MPRRNSYKPMPKSHPWKRGGAFSPNAPDNKPELRGAGVIGIDDLYDRDAERKLVEQARNGGTFNVEGGSTLEGEDK